MDVVNSRSNLGTRAQVIDSDRTGNVKYIFRHCEAAGILIVVQPELHHGHAELAWSLIMKVCFGMMHVTEQVGARSLSLSRLQCCPRSADPVAAR